MKLIYTVEGADEPRTWDFTPESLDVDEVIAIETKTGMLHPQWNDALRRGGAQAVKALLWTLMRRDNTTLRYDQLRFTMSQVRIDLDPAEKREMIDRIETQLASGEITSDAGIEAMLDDLRASVPLADDMGAAPGESAPKASPSKKSSASTSSTSPST